MKTDFQKGYNFGRTGRALYQASSPEFIRGYNTALVELEAERQEAADAADDDDGYRRDTLLGPSFEWDTQAKEVPVRLEVTAAPMTKVVQSYEALYKDEATLDEGAEAPKAVMPIPRSLKWWEGSEQVPMPCFEPDCKYDCYEKDGFRCYVPEELPPGSRGSKFFRI